MSKADAADARFLKHIKNLQASSMKIITDFKSVVRVRFSGKGSLSLWSVYMVRCSDGSLYTGVTTDINRRIHEHNNTKKGSKYCRSRRPVELVFKDGKFESRGHAQQREREIKLLSKKEKEALTTSLDFCRHKTLVVRDPVEYLKKEKAWREDHVMLFARSLIQATGVTRAALEAAEEKKKEAEKWTCSRCGYINTKPDPALKISDSALECYECQQWFEEN